MPNSDNQKILAELAKAEKDAKSLNLQVARIDGATPQAEALKLVPRKLALEFRIIPLFLRDKQLSIGFADTSLFSRPMPEFLASLKDQYSLEKYVVIASDFNEAIKAYPEELNSVQQNSAPENEKSTEISQKNTTKEPVNIQASTDNTETQPVQNITDAGQDEIIDLTSLDIPLQTLEKFPEEVAKKYLMIVFKVEQSGKLVHVACVDPNDMRVKDIATFVEKRNKVKVKLHKAKKEQIEEVLSGYKTGGYKASSPSQVSDIPAEPKEIPAEVNNIEPQEEVPVLPVAPSVPSAADIQAHGIDQIKQIASKEPIKVENTQQSPEPVSENQATPSKIVSPPSSAPVSIPTPLSGNQSSANAISGQSETNLDSQLNGKIENESQLEAVLKTGMAPKIVAGTISFGVFKEVSDIHIEPLENEVLIRYRIDGSLHEIAKLAKNLLAPMVSRIKILSNLKIDEVRLPQDGRFSVQVAEREVDLRVSTLPTVFGEKVVMRILDKSTGVRDLEKLDFYDTNLERVKKSLNEPYGIILITGPTGSGKSTTLYSMLNRLHTSKVNIVTLEDPVEYQLSGINQTQIKEKIGYGFAEGLRSIVRQDPDIIMVGEIRDSETATLATQAALTGHLVLSTLHTNNAAGAIPRLIDMDVEPFLLSSSITMVVAQRLVRRLCPNCKEPANVPDETIERVKQVLSESKSPEAAKALSEQMQFHAAKGCDNCTNGFKGRLGIFEVLTMSENMTSLIVKKETTSVLDEAARAEGMVSMRVDGILKALKGITTLDEVLQVTAE